METHLATPHLTPLRLACCLLIVAGSIQTAAAQPASGALAVTASDGLLETHTEVTWTTPAQDAMLFKITRDGDLLSIVASTVRAYSDATGAPGTVYTYCVIPSNGGVDGDAVCDAGSRILFKPSAASATDGTLDDKVLVTWTDRSSIEAGYDVYRRAEGAPDSTLLVSLPANAQTYSDESAQVGQRYRYCIVARDAKGFTSQPACDDGVRGAVRAPTRVSATDGEFARYVRITWRAAGGGEDGYAIYRDGVSIGTAGADSTRYLDATAVTGTTYRYCVAATRAGAESERACDDGRRGALTPPENVAASRDAFDDRVEVTWQDVAPTEDGFEILRDGVVIATVAANTRSYSDRSALQQVEYAYCVRAVNRSDPDEPSRSSDVCATDRGRRSAVLSPSAVSATDGTFEDRVDLTWTNPSTTALLVSVYRDGALIKTLPPSQASFADRGGIPSGVALNYCVSSSTLVGGEAPARAEMFRMIERASVEASAVEVQREARGEIAAPAEQVREARDLRAQIEAMAAAQGMTIVESARACDGGSRLIKAPTGVTATYDSDERFVEITWSNPSAVSLGFLVYRQAGSAPAVLADTVKGGARLSYRDYRGAPGTAYTYRVVAYDRHGTSAPGTGTGLRKLKAPTSLQVSNGDFEDRIVLTWTDESLAETGYRILRDGTPITDLPAGATRYVDTGVDVGAAHTYRVVAFDGYGESAPAEAPGSSALLPPGSLRASTTYPDKVVLVWVDASAHNTGYRVLRNGTILTEALAGTATGYTDAEPPPSGTADYCVESIAGSSSASTRECVEGGVSGAVTLLGGGSSVGVAQRVMADNSRSNDEYGHAVALSGDYAVVGQPGNAPRRAYILYRDPAQGWQQQAVLTSAGGRFGSSVAISGDYAAVGDVGSTTVTIFERNANGSNAWGQVAVLGPGSYMQGFGLSIALEGNTLLVGTQVGLAYEYVRGSHGWAQRSVITAPELDDMAKFGATVALEGDVAVIGRIRFVGDADSRTVGYVYVRNGNGWERQAALMVPPGPATLRYPTTVALSGDYAFVAELPSAATGGPGTVRVFRREGATWALMSTLLASDHDLVANPDQFGQQVAIRGDQAFISSEGDNTKGARAGAVYHFRLVDGTWREVAKLLPDDGSGDTNESNGEFFGVSLALGDNELLVGARGARRTSGENAGAVYVQPLLSPPSAVTVSDGQYPDRVQIRWKDESLHETGFRIYRIEEAGQVKLVGTAPKNAEVFDDYSATPGSAYTYLVTAFSSDLAALDPNCTFLDASTPQAATNCLGESSPGRDTGWRPTNGALSGRIAALGGGGTEGAEVCLTPSLNRSLQLDGTSGSVETGTFDLSGDAITIEYWFKGRSMESIVRQQSNDVFILSGDHRLHLLSNDNPYSDPMPVGDAVTDGQWHHVAMTWQRNTDGGYRSYLDGELVRARRSSDKPLPKLDVPLFLGSKDGQQLFASGQLDEVRIWRVARSQEQIQAAMNSSLTGREPGLVAYWPFDEGAREVTAERTGRGRNGRFIGGAYWSEEGAPMAHCATTDREGNFTFRGLSYGEATTFTLTPTLGDRSFGPAFKKITLSTEVPVQNEVDFVDKTAFTASGTVQYAGTSCPVPDVEIFVAKGREAPVLKGTTGSDGAFSVSIDPSTGPADRRTLTPRLGSGQDAHLFSPRDTSFVMTGHLADLSFVDRQQRVLNLSFGGSCNTDIGTATVKIFTEDGCYEREVQVSGSYALQLPPQKYLVQVVGVAGAPPALAAGVTEFFDDFGARPVDLTAADDTLTLTYRAPIVMTITGFPEPLSACAIPGLATVDGAGESLGRVLPNVPIIGEHAEVELAFDVYENYGSSQTCPVDAGTLTIFDGIGDVKDPVVLKIENGRATYTTRGTSPDVSDGRMVDGVDRSFQKRLTAIAAVEGADPVTETRWAIVNGGREDEANGFVSVVTDEIPLLILHDPPGSNSFAYVNKGTTRCTTASKFELSSGGVGVDIDFVIGFKADVGFATPFFSTHSSVGGGLGVRTRTLAGRITEDVTGGIETCIVADERFATSGDVGWSGEDVFVGVALNLLFAEMDVIEARGGSCEVSVRRGIVGDLDKNKPFETTFVYGASHIEYTLIPALENLVAQQPDYEVKGDLSGGTGAIRLQGALENWRKHLADNDSVKVEALKEPLENRSFSAGADYEHSADTTKTSFSSNSTRAYVTSEGGVGAVITAFYDQTFLIAYEGRGEWGRDTSEANGTQRTVGYVLSDGDAGDFFSVDIGKDPRYGTPVFGVVGGRSSNPWEENTQRRDNPRIEIDPPVLYNVDPADAGRFKLTLINASESRERRQYTLAVPGETNIRNLALNAAGGPLGGTRTETFLLDPGEARTLNLDVKAGSSAYSYDSVGVVLYSAEEYDIWKGDRRFPLAASDTAWLSVHFKAPCSPISILRPVQNWVLNAASISDSLEVILNRFDLRGSGEGAVSSLGLEYRLQGTSAWLPAASVQSSRLSGASSWAARWRPARDGAYEVRAFTECPVGKVYSDVLPGVVDTKAPRVFGTPSPADQVLALGSDISITFDEDIACSSVHTQGALANAMLTYLDGAHAGTNIPGVEATCDGRKLLLAPPETFDWAAAEGMTLEARLLTNVLDGQQKPVVLTDLAGNPIPRATSWPFTVRRSAFAWSPVNVEANVTRGTRRTVETTLVNGRATAADFALPATFDLVPDGGGAPIPLALSVGTGSIVSGGSKTVAFALPDTLAPGTYTALLEAARMEGSTMRERIPFYLTAHVVCAPPDAWRVDPAAFQYSMTLTAQLMIDGLVAQDLADRVVAMAGSEVRGVGSIAEVAPGLYRLQMVIYSNTRTGEAITFRVWDDDQCTLHEQTSKTLVFEDGATHGTVSAPVVLAAPLVTGPDDVVLSAGWTWFSLNRTASDASVNALLSGVAGSPGDVVKGQSAFSLFDAGYGWLGTLATLVPGRGYQIQLQQSNVLTQQGTPVDVTTTPVAFHTGWNWIGYLPQQAMTVGWALNDFSAEPGDIIKSQSAFAQYADAATGWVGSLAMMEPGRGYLLKTSGAAADFKYPLAAQSTTTAAHGPLNASAAAAESETQATRQQHRPDWSVDAGAYPSNMTVTARVYLDGTVVSAEGSLVAVFAGEECRGVASVQVVPGLGQPLAFLVVHGDGPLEEGLTIRLYDASSDSIYTGVSTLPFTPDAVLGTIQQPFVLQASATTTALGEGGLPTAFALEQNFPNPFGPSTTIRYALAQPASVQLRVYDVLGREVRRLVDAQQPAGWYEVLLDAEGLASGVYFYRIEAGSFKQFHRMMLVK